jgi:hypothetical protein
MLSFPSSPVIWSSFGVPFRESSPGVPMMIATFNLPVEVEILTSRRREV